MEDGRFPCHVMTTSFAFFPFPPYTFQSVNKLLTNYHDYEPNFNFSADHIPPV